MTSMNKDINDRICDCKSSRPSIVSAAVIIVLILGLIAASSAEIF